MRSVPKKVLLLKECCLGDVLMVTPVARAVRRAFPDCEIVFGVGEFAQAVIANSPHIDRVVLYPRIWNPRNDWSLLRRFRYVRQLRREQFDLILCMEMGSRIAAICRMIGAPVRAGFNWRGEGLLHTVRLRRWPNDRSGVSAGLALLELLDIPDAGRELEFHPTDAGRTEADRLLRDAGVTDGTRVVAVGPGGGDNPGTTMPTKRWPADRYRALVERLTALPGIRVVLIGGPGDRDITGAVGAGRNVLDIAGQVSLDVTGALLRRCALYIGNDSGPLHLAVASGIPTVSLFGPTDPALYVPQSPSHSALWAGLECSPCHKTILTGAHECTNPHFLECMDVLSIDRVYQACEARLAAHASRPQSPPS